MPQGLDQVPAAEQTGIFDADRRHRLRIEEKTLPESDPAPQVPWKRQVVFAHFPRGWRQRVDIGLEVEQVPGASTGIGGVGKRRVVMPPVRGHPVGHGMHEIPFGPAADSARGVRRNVGYPEGAESRHHIEAASQVFTVAGRAAARMENPFAVGQVRFARRRLERGRCSRHGGQPEGGQEQQGEARRPSG